MSKKISMHALAKSIEDEFYNKSENGKVSPSYKTIERRFMQFVGSFGIDIKELKNKNGEIYLEETEAVFVQGIIAQSLDKKGFVYKFLITGELNELDLATLLEIGDFMKYMYEYMTDKMSDDDRDSYIMDLNRNFKYTALLERENIYRLIDALYLNLNSLLYSHQVSLLLDLKKVLEKEFVRSNIEIVLNTIEVAQIIKDHKEMTGEARIDYDYLNNDDIAEEYRQRDRDILVFLEENPLIKEHIETKLNMTVEELFK
ncbi:hypothetical protein [Paenibacillus sp. Leaf72]|uniref:hypothetical protein n=1 Tax=Paenibacillus sp. Leaf72 TaxID=1736234 RepID=UPI0006FF7DE1|nr:hypothetical protein [Paenibacillus sp. Leaf72]KQO18059.1 hypothetical protein ASF12_05295 [Paenibacillus sp. Leaf72]